MAQSPQVHPSINDAHEDECFSFADARDSGLFHGNYGQLRAARHTVRAEPNPERTHLHGSRLLKHQSLFCRGLEELLAQEQDERLAAEH